MKSLHANTHTPLFRGFITLAVAVGTLFATALPASAAVSPGDVFKGTESTVYYYAKNSTRLVFPNKNIFFSWYPDFSTIKTISTNDLQNIPLGGNVLYRPGSRLIKIQSDPRVYVVSAHGVLHWLKTEEVAIQLYGSQWAQRVDDISDAFFPNYQMGSVIDSTSTGQLLIQGSDIDIDTNQQPAPAETTSTTPIAIVTPTSTDTVSSTPPAPAPITIVASKPTIQGGDTLGLTATLQSGITPNKVDLFFDGILIASCQSSPCYGETQVPVSGTKASYVLEAQATTITDQTFSVTTTIPYQKPEYSPLLHLQAAAPIVRIGEAASVTLLVDGGLFGRLDILVDMRDVKGCLLGERRCQWSDYLTGPSGTTHIFYGVLTDGIGRQYASAPATITMTDSNAPLVTVTPQNTSINVGQTVDVAVTASGVTSISSIDILQNDTVLKHCDGATQCTATTGPWNTTGTLMFVGRATDITGLSSTATATQPVLVSAP